jgi:predicted dehydrogenase
VNDCTVSVLKYPNDVIGKVMVSIGCKRPYTMRTQIFGTKGTILTDNTSPTLTLYKEFVYADTGKAKCIPTEIPIPVNNHNMTAEIKDMCDVILGKIPLEIDAVEGANTVAVCRAAVDSVATGLPVKPQYFR